MKTKTDMKTKTGLNRLDEISTTQVPQKVCLTTCSARGGMA